MRILPYVWPHRKKLALSALFAMLVAMFWSLNLSAVFPVVKVLMEQQSLREYVDREIATSEAEIEQRTAEAIEALDSLGLDGEPQAALTDLARFVSARRF